MADIFISHVEEDAPMAIDIAQALEVLGFSTWYYERDTVPGRSYLIQIGEEIETCRAVMLLISSHSLGSYQVTQEVIRAYESHKPFIPLLIDVSHNEFQTRQPEWRSALGATASLRIPPEGLANIVPQIAKGLAALGIYPGEHGTSSTPSPVKAPEQESRRVDQTEAQRPQAAEQARQHELRVHHTKEDVAHHPFYNKIFLCDIVDFSRVEPLLQQQFQRDMTQLFRALLHDLHLTLMEDVIALPTWDGMILNFIIQQPDIHLKTATEILKLVHGYNVSSNNPLQLRIGLNAHTDFIVTDMNNMKNVVGNGINLAQRVMNLGRPGQILMHDRVRLDLEQYPDYGRKMVYRGEYTVPPNKRLPIAQFVDHEHIYLNNELLPLPAQQALADPVTVDLATILQHRIQENLLKITLDGQAHHHLDLVREYIEDFLDKRGEFQRLKIVVIWIAGEMLDNAFRYGVLGRDGQVVLSLHRTKSSIIVEVEQPDVARFDLAQILRRRQSQMRFMSLMDRRGLHWRQWRSEARMTLALEIPHDFELETLNVLQAHTDSAHVMPPEIKDFLDRKADICIYNKTMLMRVTISRIDHNTAKEFENLYLPRITSDYDNIILDLSMIDYCSSAGIRVFLLMYRASTRIPGQRIAFASLSRFLQDIFRTIRFDLLFPCYEDVASALRALVEM